MNEQERALVAYVMLLVQQAGGEVKIPYSVVNKGFEPNFGININPDDESEELVFTIEEVEIEQS